MRGGARPPSVDPAEQRQASQEGQAGGDPPAERICPGGLRLRPSHPGHEGQGAGGEGGTKEGQGRGETHHLAGPGPALHVCSPNTVEACCWG